MRNEGGKILLEVRGLKANVSGIEILKGIDLTVREGEVHAIMATGKLDIGKDAHHLGRLTVFSGVCDLPTRVKCAILPWHTLHAAFHSIASTSTESDDDPMHESTPGGVA